MKLPVVALAAMLIVPLYASAEAPSSTILARSGAWTAFSGSEGAETACGVQSDIAGLRFILFGRSDRPNTLRLTLTKQNWQIPNLTVPIVLTFQDAETLQLTGRGAQSFIRSDLPASSVKTLIHRLTSDVEATLTLPEGHEAPWRLDLRGTTESIQAMAHCLEAAQISLPPPFTQAHAPGASFSQFPTSAVDEIDGRGSLRFGMTQNEYVDRMNAGEKLGGAVIDGVPFAIGAHFDLTDPIPFGADDEQFELSHSKLSKITLSTETKLPYRTGVARCPADRVIADLMAKYGQPTYYQTGWSQPLVENVNILLRTITWGKGPKTIAMSFDFARPGGCYLNIIYADSSIKYLPPPAPAPPEGHF